MTRVHVKCIVQTGTPCGESPAENYAGTTGVNWCCLEETAQCGHSRCELQEVSSRGAATWEAPANALPCQYFKHNSKVKLHCTTYNFLTILDSQAEIAQPGSYLSSVSHIFKSDRPVNVWRLIRTT